MNREDTIKEIVIARLEAMPKEIGVSFGNPAIDILGKEEMIRQVREGTEIGKDIIKIQMDFLTSLKDMQPYG